MRRTLALPTPVLCLIFTAGGLALCSSLFYLMSRAATPPPEPPVAAVQPTPAPAKPAPAPPPVAAPATQEPPAVEEPFEPSAEDDAWFLREYLRHKYGIDRESTTADARPWQATERYLSEFHRLRDDTSEVLA